MTKYSNPGIVNTAHVRATSDGVTERKCPSGDTHVTAYTTGGRRISWDEKPDGTIANVHSTNADGDHVNYKGGR